MSSRKYFKIFLYDALKASLIFSSPMDSGALLMSLCWGTSSIVWLSDHYAGFHLLKCG